MSAHVEWVDFSFIELLREGEQVGENEVTEEFAIAVGFDTIAVFEGTEERLRQLAHRITKVLDNAKRGPSTKRRWYPDG